jgi:hypothetical protein
VRTTNSMLFRARWVTALRPALRPRSTSGCDHGRGRPDHKADKAQARGLTDADRSRAISCVRRPHRRLDRPRRVAEERAGASNRSAYEGGGAMTKAPRSGDHPRHGAGASSPSPARGLHAQYSRRSTRSPNAGYDVSPRTSRLERRSGLPAGIGAATARVWPSTASGQFVGREPRCRLRAEVDGRGTAREPDGVVGPFNGCTDRTHNPCKLRGADTTYDLTPAARCGNMPDPAVDLAARQFPDRGTGGYPTSTCT